MASLNERLTKRFKDVPGVESTDIADWIAEAEAESGLEKDTDTETDNALLYLAFSIGCQNIATNAARFFSYTDGDESVDKTKVFENYSLLSIRARKQYVLHRNGGTSYAYFAKRADGR